MSWMEQDPDEWMIENDFEFAWLSPTTPEQQYLAAKIRCGDLDGAMSIVGNLTPERRQELTKDSSLFIASLRKNNPRFIRFLVEECNAELDKSIKKCVSGEYVGDDSITPLRYAARFMKTEAVGELLRLGANVNAVSPNSRLTALHDACKNGCLDIARHLIQHGADLTVSNIRGKTALMFGIDHVDVCRELIARGADVNATDDAGDTALHSAVRRNSEVVKLLIENGADLFKKNNQDEDAHYIACVDLAIDIVKFMRDHLSDDDVGHEALIRSHQLLGACYLSYSRKLYRYSGVAEALTEWEAAVRLREKRRHVSPGEDNAVSTPNSAYDNAVEVDSMVKFNEMRFDANKIYVQAVLLKEKILGPTHSETIESVINLAEFFIVSKDYGRGLRLMRHGFKLSRDHRVNSSWSGIFLEQIEYACVRYFVPTNKHAFNNTADFKDVYEFLEAITVEVKHSGRPIAEDGTMSERFMQIGLFLIKLFFLVEANENYIVQFRRLLPDFVRLNFRSWEGRTLLMRAVCPFSLCDYMWFPSEVDAIKLLLESGADTWETDYDGNSVLHMLTKSEEWILDATDNLPSKEAIKKVAELLLAFGAHFDARNNEGFTAVDYLSSLGLEFSAHLTLECLAARAIRRHKIPYAGILPKSLVDFVQMH